MKDIFCSLDPSVSINNWFNFSLLLFLMSGVLFVIFSTYLNTFNTTTWVLSQITLSYVANVNAELGKNFKNITSLFYGVFGLLLALNLTGLIPYNYSMTTSALFNLSIGLVMWLAINMSSVSFNFISFFSHLTPEGAPLVLVPLLNLIETVSNFIRFITLTLRISINIMTGHIFITLMSIMLYHTIMNFSVFSTISLLTIQGGYLFFEVAVALLQAYVFSLLLFQYTMEHPI